VKSLNERSRYRQVVTGGLIVTFLGFQLGVGLSMANPHNQPPVLGPFFIERMWDGLWVVAYGSTMMVCEWISRWFE